MAPILRLVFTRVLISVGECQKVYSGLDTIRTFLGRIDKLCIISSQWVKSKKEG